MTSKATAPKTQVANLRITSYSPNLKFNMKHKGLDDGNWYGGTEKENFTVGDFCQRMTSHGLIDWYEAKTSLGKTLWAALIFASVALLSYQITMEFYEFFTGAIQTTLSFVPVKALKFPQIYICPLSFVNRFCVSNWTEYREQVGIFKQNTGSILDNKGSSWQILGPMISPSDGEYEPNEYACGPQDQGYLKHIAMPVQDYFKECKFNGQNVTCDCIAETYLDKEFGVCYLVDVSQLSNGMQVTENIGLNLVIDTHSEYFPRPNDLGSREIVRISGAQIRAGNPVDPSSFGGTFVQVGTYARMRLSAQEVNLIDWAYSKTPQHCIKENQYKMKYFNTTYSAELCRMDCTQAMIKETCDCVMPFDSRWVEFTERFTNSCTEYDFDQCVIPKVQSSTQTTSELRKCIDLCHNPCHRWEYDITLSDLRLPEVPPKVITERKYMDLVTATCPNKNVSITLKCPLLPPTTTSTATSPPTTTSEASPDLLAAKNETSGLSSALHTENDPPVYLADYNYYGPPCTEPNPYACPVADPCAFYQTRYWAGNYMILDIAFSKFQYMQLQQSPPRTITTLLSNIGGQAGLWTGASIFTVVQAVIFASYLAYSKMNRKP